MIFLRHSALSILLLLAGCGLEDYQYLPAPVLPRYLEQTDFTKLTFSHDPAVFAGRNFLGYEIYYRIYPWSTGDRGNLVRDAETLKSAGLAALDAAGYRRLNLAEFTSGVPLLEFPEDSGVQAVTLDFSDFLEEQFSLGLNASTPVLTVTGSSGETSTKIFRNSSLLEPQFSSFGSLLEQTTAQTASAPDLAKTVTVATTEFEVLFFVLSYSYSDLLVASVSAPVPWGIISRIKKVQ